MASINLKLDLGNMFVECEGGTDDCLSISIADALKDELIRSVKHDVFSKISADLEQQLSDAVITCIRKEVEVFVSATLSSLITNLKVKGRYDSDEKDAKQYLKEQLEKEILDHKCGAIVSKTAKEYAETIKERYDVVFASTLLDKMMKANLLKDDRIASLLTTD